MRKLKTEYLFDAHFTVSGTMIVGIEEDGRIYGDGVNIAARVENLAISRVKMGDKIGRGALDQLIIGPHASSGFSDIMDMVP